MSTESIIRSYYAVGDGNDDRYHKGEIPLMIQASLGISIQPGVAGIIVSLYGPNNEERDSIPLSITDARSFAENLISMIDVLNKQHFNGK